MDRNLPRLGDELPRLVERMVASYRDDPRTQHIDKQFLPDRRATIDIVHLLLELTYPGFFGRMGLSNHNISYHVGDLLPRLYQMLATEIEQCLCFDFEARECPDAVRPCTDKAAELARTFLHRMPDVRTLLAGDVQAAYDGDPAARNIEETILAYPGVLAVTVHRFAHELFKLDVPLMPRIMAEHAHQATGIDIHPGAQIGRNFFIDHGTGVVIGETSVIGDNVKLYQGVTLGARSFPKDERGRIIRGQKRHPTVGDNVTIYANATILGGETVIGDGAVVGGSVVVMESVAPGHQVLMAQPELKIRKPKNAVKS